MSLVKFTKVNTPDKTVNMIQDGLIRTLNPIFDTPTLNGVLLSEVPLISGTNIINHRLSRNLIGWQIVRQRAAASIYDDQDNNSTPSINLILISDAAVIVDIYCF